MSPFETATMDDYNAQRGRMTDASRRAIDNLMRDIFPITSPIDPSTNAPYNRARNWTVPRDPLVLDLDGDGIEATRIDPNSPVLFDRNANGIKNATGWVKASDGIVVRDIDGNGLIESCRELFGDNTLITRGTRTGKLAANGFEALADIDLDGNGLNYGRLDANDVAYSSITN